MEIHELKLQGASIREIAKRLGYSRNTVRKWLRNRDLPKVKRRAVVPSKLEPYHDYLRCRMAEGVLNCNRLLAELKAQGYSGGKTILKDFVKPFRPPVRPAAVVRFETAPGDQAQVDFGVFQYHDEQGIHRLYAFVLVLSYSRAAYVEFVERPNLTNLLRCHVHAFEALGGMPKTILYDNLKPVVLGRNGEKVTWNPRFADFALTCGFQPRACRPYRAQTKGRVERMVGYLRQNFWPGLKFSDLADLNSQVREWSEATANQRIHGTTGKRPAELLKAEKLLPNPDRSLLSAFVSEERQVSRDGFVSYAGSLYGVPWQYSGRSVQVREVGPYVEISSGQVRLALHPKAAPGCRANQPGQWDGLPLGGFSRERKVIALRVPTPEVEVRPLSVYEALAGGEVR